MDTAGIRDTEDIIEKIGVDKAINSAKESDLIIYIIDSSVSLDGNDFDILQSLEDKKSIILLNKSDLGGKIQVDDVRIEYLERHTNFKEFNIPVIEISAKTGQGIDELEDAIRDMFYHGQLSFNTEIYITNMRHKNALIEANESLNKVMQSIDLGMPEDFYSIDLMDAYESLGSIIGESMGEDLVNEIFSKFCMGK